MFDVISIGEVLIDFTPLDNGGKDVPAFEMNPGGAPANCLAALSALGAKTAFIGKVGDDKFGEFLRNYLSDRGIDVANVSKTKSAHTTLAYVHLAKNGERDFTFLRNPGADTLLGWEDIDVSILGQTSVVHFGSLSLTDNPCRQSVLRLIRKAKKANKIISYDPNYRPLLWKDETEAKRWMVRGIKLADIVKLSEEEVQLITGETSVEQGAKRILDMGAKTVFVTMGAEGVFFRDEEHSGYVKGYQVDAVDTTGCGDAFMGAVLYKMVCDHETDIELIARFGNAVGALCATQRGGIPAMPNKSSINDFLHQNQ